MTTKTWSPSHIITTADGKHHFVMLMHDGHAYSKEEWPRVSMISRFFCINADREEWTLDGTRMSDACVVAEYGNGDSVTDDQIVRLRTEAGEVGDDSLVAACDRAMHGESLAEQLESRDVVARCIHDAMAQIDD